MKEGWISLYRNIEEHPVFKDPYVFKVWMWILMNANYKDKSVLIGKQVVDLKVGQLIFSRNSAAQKLDMSDSRVYRTVQLLEQMGCIKIDVNRKISIINVLNWGKYQVDEQKVNRKRTDVEQIVNTSNNINNINNYNNLNSAHACVATPKATKFSNFTPSKNKVDYRAIELNALKKRLERMKENDG